MRTRVLILDDDADLLGALEEALSQDTFEVETHGTVQSATHALGRARFDVVVTDLGLSRTSGLAFCEQLAKSAASPPVVVMTGHAEARAAALKLGARQVLVKPVELDHLKRVLREVALSGAR